MPNEKTIPTAELTQVVWLKRDLRLSDHAPLKYAAMHGPVLIVYVFEPSLIANEHYGLRHWRFVSESIDEMNEQLKSYNARVICFKRESISMLELLQQHLGRFALWSHEEIGLEVTFQRDIDVKAWCDQHQTAWYETPYSGVQRALAKRSFWYERWHELIQKPCNDIDLASVNWLNEEQLPMSLNIDQRETSWTCRDENFQEGGEKQAWRVLESFVAGRGLEYAFKLSSPDESRTACSRLSPYLAWGNISTKQVYQYLSRYRSDKRWRRTVQGVQSRLQWRDHFIQKFESEHAMEHRSVNRAYVNFPYLQNESERERLLTAWKKGATGISLVDACMRALIKTGYLNFRMRAMLVSVLCHHMNIDWRYGSAHLASLFLDFEPGIHYPQFQMQAGVTGINAIRLYSPIKQAQEKDAEGVFIRQWCPELKALPNALLFDPSMMTDMEAIMYEFEAEQRYLHPVVDLQQSGKNARNLLWTFQSQSSVQSEAQRILQRHTIPNRSRMLNGPVA